MNTWSLAVVGERGPVHIEVVDELLLTTLARILQRKLGAGQLICHGRVLSNGTVGDGKLLFQSTVLVWRNTE